MTEPPTMNPFAHCDHFAQYTSRLPVYFSETGATASETSATAPTASTSAAASTDDAMMCDAPPVVELHHPRPVRSQSLDLATIESSTSLSGRSKRTHNLSVRRSSTPDYSRARALRKSSPRATVSPAPSELSLSALRESGQTVLDREEESELRLQARQRRRRIFDFTGGRGANYKLKALIARGDSEGVARLLAERAARTQRLNVRRSRVRQETSRQELLLEQELALRQSFDPAIEMLVAQLAVI